MSETLLEATVAAVVRRIGGRLPAAYTLDPQDLRVGGEDADHTLPDGGTAVRWALGTDDGHLVVAITADAAEMLAAEGPLVDVMTARVEAAAIDLAIAFGGIPPMLGEGVEVDPSTAFEGPTGEPVSVLLDDAGVHRATIGLRLELTDALMGPVPEDLPEFDLGPFPGDDEPTEDAEDVDGNAVDPARDDHAGFIGLRVGIGLNVGLEPAPVEGGRVEHHGPDSCFRVALRRDDLEDPVRPGAWFQVVFQTAEGEAAVGEIIGKTDEGQFAALGKFGEIRHGPEGPVPDRINIHLGIEIGVAVVAHRVPVPDVGFPYSLDEPGGFLGRDIMEEFIEGEGFLEFKLLAAPAVAVGLSLDEVDRHVVSKCQ